ncbi:MAG: NAD(P)-dependent oxidoreductase [Anaerolineae bacterium]
MRVLVTGHDGYIGALLVPLLHAAGHEVVGLDTFYFEDGSFNNAQAAHPDLPTLRKDLRDLTVDDLRGFDAVAHLAALSNDPMGNMNADWTYDINHAASVRLAELAKAAGVSRYAYSSSCSMYGIAGDDFLTEDAPQNPVTAYAVSKVRTEEDVRPMADDDFSPVFLRNATAYGASPRLRVDLVLNNLVGWGYTTGKIRIMSDGTPWRPLVHAEDIARAFVAVFSAPRERIHNEAFNVGVTAHNYRIRELADIVKEVIPGCEVEYAPQPEADSRTYRVSFEKIARVLGDVFQPQWDARRGAEQLYAAYQAAGLTFEDFQSRRYIRLKQLQYLMDNDRLDSTLRWKDKA